MNLLEASFCLFSLICICSKQFALKLQLHFVCICILNVIRKCYRFWQINKQMLVLSASVLKRFKTFFLCNVGAHLCTSVILHRQLSLSRTSQSTKKGTGCEILLKVLKALQKIDVPTFFSELLPEFANGKITLGKLIL